MNSRGMTIIELITVLIVLGVLVTLVVGPSMRGMAARHRVEAVNAELLTDLQLARSELAQQSDNVTLVALSFGGDAQRSCYTVHTVDVAASGVACDCTRTPGTVCAPFAPGAREIKTIQFERAVGTSMAASSPAGPRILFTQPQGLAIPDGLVIDVQDTASGQLRTTVNGRGVPNVCSPDGSIRGVRTPC
jgi:prepilin-type N-terminal cleavage/methylation domain-containing protein